MKFSCPSCQHPYEIPASVVESSPYGFRVEVRGDGDCRVEECVHGCRWGVGAGWFIIRDGTFDGPHPTSNVVAEAQRGVVKLQTLLWRSGMSRWEIAGATPPLAPELAEGSRWWPNSGTLDRLPVDSVRSIAQPATMGQPSTHCFGSFLQGDRRLASMTSWRACATTSGGQTGCYSRAGGHGLNGSRASTAVPRRNLRWPLQSEERAFETSVMLSPRIQATQSFLHGSWSWAGMEAARGVGFNPVSTFTGRFRGHRYPQGGGGGGKTFEGLGKPLDALMVCKRYQVPASNGTMLRLLRACLATKSWPGA